jgi:hypothetical protein
LRCRRCSNVFEQPASPARAHRRLPGPSHSDMRVVALDPPASGQSGRQLGHLRQPDDPVRVTTLQTLPVAGTPHRDERDQQKELAILPIWCGSGAASADSGGHWIPFPEIRPRTVGPGEKAPTGVGPPPKQSGGPVVVLAAIPALPEGLLGSCSLLGKLAVVTPNLPLQLLPLAPGRQSRRLRCLLLAGSRSGR